VERPLDQSRATMTCIAQNRGLEHDPCASGRIWERRAMISVSPKGRVLQRARFSKAGEGGGWRKRKRTRGGGIRTLAQMRQGEVRTLWSPKGKEDTTVWRTLISLHIGKRLTSVMVKRLKSAGPNTSVSLCQKGGDHKQKESTNNLGGGERGGGGVEEFGGGGW